MKRISRVATCFAFASALMLSAACATASADDIVLTPSTLQFGSLEIGQTSAPQSLTMTVDEPFRNEVGFGTGGRDYEIVDDDCGALMGVLGSDTCTITVIFHPIAPGPRGGVLITGEYLTRPAPPLPTTQAKPAQMLGFGLCPTCIPPIVNGIPGTTPPDGIYGGPGTTTKKKRCKRKLFPSKKKYRRCVRKQKRRN